MSAGPAWRALATPARMVCPAPGRSPAPGSVLRRRHRRAARPPRPARPPGSRPAPSRPRLARNLAGRADTGAATAMLLSVAGKTVWTSPSTRESPGKSFPFASSYLRELPPSTTIERSCLIRSYEELGRIRLPCAASCPGIRRAMTGGSASALDRPHRSRGMKAFRVPPPCNSLPRQDSLLACEAPGMLVEAKVLIEQGRRHTNTVRPHTSAGYRPPAPEIVLSRTPVPTGPPSPAGSAPAPGTMLNQSPTPTTRRSWSIRLLHNRMSSINR